LASRLPPPPPSNLIPCLLSSPHSARLAGGRYCEKPTKEGCAGYAYKLRTNPYYPKFDHHGKNWKKAYHTNKLYEEAAEAYMGERTKGSSTVYPPHCDAAVMTGNEPLCSDFDSVEAGACCNPTTGDVPLEGRFTRTLNSEYKAGGTAVEVTFRSSTSTPVPLADGRMLLGPTRFDSNSKAEWPYRICTVNASLGDSTKCTTTLPEAGTVRTKWSALTFDQVSVIAAIRSMDATRKIAAVDPHSLNQKYYRRLADWVRPGTVSIDEMLHDVADRNAKTGKKFRAVGISLMASGSLFTGLFMSFEPGSWFWKAYFENIFGRRFPLLAVFQMALLSTALLGLTIGCFWMRYRAVQALEIWGATLGFVFATVGLAHALRWVRLRTANREAFSMAFNPDGSFRNGARIKLVGCKCKLMDGLEGVVVRREASQAGERVYVVLFGGGPTAPNAAATNGGSQPTSVVPEKVLQFNPVKNGELDDNAPLL
jgi:hypothetical protein